VGAVIGGLVSVLIVALYFLVARHAIDPTIVQGKVEPLGLTDPATFLALAAYIVFINSALEEYVYRWFVFRKWETLVGGYLAVVGSALVFVVHHTIILAAYFPTWIVVLGSIGVFVGGVIWSLLYLNYRSIWPPYLSHAIVDVAVLAVGYWIIMSPG
jgi:membrane protease YdiL (CAAX protease family)